MKDITILEAREMLPTATNGYIHGGKTDKIEVFIDSSFVEFTCHSTQSRMVIDKEELLEFLNKVDFT